MPRTTLFPPPASYQGTPEEWAALPYQKRYRLRYPDRRVKQQRNHKLRYSYGLSRVEYDELLEKQNTGT